MTARYRIAGEAWSATRTPAAGVRLEKHGREGKVIDTLVLSPAVWCDLVFAMCHHGTTEDVHERAMTRMYIERIHMGPPKGRG